MRAELSRISPDFAERDFFKDKFTVEEIKALVGPRPVSDLFASRSPSVKKYGLDPSGLSGEEMLEWMVKEPRLIKRPLVMVDGQLLVQPNQKTLEEALTLL